MLVLTNRCKQAKSQHSMETTENTISIIQLTWDFGDNFIVINGTSPDLVNAIHTYTASGVYNATLTVKFDSALKKTETDTATITVVDNQPPIADAGPDQSVEQTSAQGTNVTLDGTVSSYPDNDTLTYYWYWTGGLAMGANPTVLFAVENTTVTLTVTDGQFNATDTINIIVQTDTTQPMVNAGLDVAVKQESHTGIQVI